MELAPLDHRKLTNYHSTVDYLIMHYEITLFTRSLRMENVTLFSTSAHLNPSELRSGKARESEGV